MKETMKCKESRQLHNEGRLQINVVNLRKNDNLILKTLDNNGKIYNLAIEK